VGVVVADTSGAWLGQRLDVTRLANAVPIEVGGVRVGMLLTNGGMGAQGGQAREVLSRVNRGFWLAALAAGLAAVAAGGLLAYGLVRPIRRLTAATTAVARGQLDQRVPVTTRDEVGELGAAFNAMAASLERAARLRRDMTADIAHELRNPIAVLQGNLEAVVDGVLAPTPDNLQPLLDQTHLLARLVDDLRTLAQAEAGQLALECALVDPAALARQAAARWAPQAEARGVALEVEAADDLPNLRLDAQRMAQVLDNLLHNSLRHTPTGGRITIQAARAGGEVTFTVKDTGPGVAAEALPHLFERFYRADGGRARADGGSGLGLAIVRQLVAAHGGRVWARSEPGQGLEVGIGLPAK
jgi:signal transduction histidine kinase